MRVARGAVVLKDADVVDAVPRFPTIADPPHDFVLPNTISASEPPRDNVQLFNQTGKLQRKLRPAQLDEASGHYKPPGIVKSVHHNGFRSMILAKVPLMRLNGGF